MFVTHWKIMENQSSNEELSTITSVFRVYPTADFYKLCRTCLVKQGVTSLSEVLTKEAMNLREVLQFCTNIQVKVNDVFPQKVCSICIKELLKTYQFIRKCKNSDSVLTSIECTSKTIEIAEEKQNELRELNNLGNKEINEGVQQEIVDTAIVIETINSKSTKSNLKCCTTKSLRKKRRLKYVDKTSDRTCRICLKIFAVPYLLKEHMRSHTKERPYHCDICPASFTNSSNLRRHVRIHTGDKPHVCDICNKAFTQATSLSEHKHTHTGEKPYVCYYCGKTYRSYTNHKNHLLKHSVLKNDQVHDDQVAKKTLDNLICKQCGRSLSSKGALKTHMLIHGDKSFLCSKCGKTFVTNGGFINHSRTHTGEMPFKCDTCEKSFSLQSSFKEHILIHTGQKPHQCKICSKSFVQYHQLKYHMRTHSGERPYICPYCGKAFTLNGNLTVHKRIHTGETPYLCPLCNKGFYDSSSLKNHQKGHKNVAAADVSSSEHCGVMTS